MDGRRGTGCLVAALLVSVSSSLWVHPARAVWARVSQPGRVSAPAILSQSVGARSGLASALRATGPFTWTQQAELTSTAQTSNDGYGLAVALSGDTAVVGAPVTPYLTAYGAAYVFARVGSAWTQQAELIDPGGMPYDEFGYAVAISGTTLAVGAPGVHGGLGAVYVYGRTGTTWTLQATLTAADATQPESFATALALSGDTLVVGADGQNGGNGAIYIFGRRGSLWGQQAEFGDPGGVPDAEFGWSVALSGDTVVVGAPNAPEAAVYVRRGGVWAFQAALHAAHAPALFFGISVAVSGDTALVGACCDTLGRQTGAVYVFGRSGSVWTLLATIPPPPGANGNSFGHSVALSGDTAVVGIEEGAYAYTGQGSTWSAPIQLIPSDRPANTIGYVVAVSGATALVGATAAPSAAYVFVRHRVGDATPAADAGMVLRPTPLGYVR